MKHLYLIIVIFITSLGISYSQVSEIGLAGGVSFYLGDINPSGVFKGSRPAEVLFIVTILIHYWHLSPRFCLDV